MRSGAKVWQGFFCEKHVNRWAGTGPEVVKAASNSTPQSFVIV